jgi:ABC-2 type transport system ATP-binding protein
MTPALKIATLKTGDTMDNAIETEHLERRFRATEAVKDLTLSVPPGSIYAYVGPNGAGKTTTIKVLMNLLEPSGGRASVLGCDSTRLRPALLQRIGYVSENQRLLEWMSVEELIDYCAPMYPTWDKELCRKLLQMFSLDPKQKIKNLSRGMKMKAALLCSISYRPSLLVMDEPFAGLDPMVRDELIRAVLEIVDREEWTFFISSHDIDEVERLADHVGFLDQGRLRFSESVASLQARFRKIEVVVAGNPEIPATLPKEWLLVEKAAHTVRFVHSDFSEDGTESEIKAFFPGTQQVTGNAMSLKEIFMTLGKSYRRAAA